ncbi:MAG: hypothetical protein RLY57_535 [Candidatus Parcubacteria bacterium]|jgi:glycosyltransferase involved in cell wall biosynthesis
MKKKLLVIIPDRFFRASGGMGANSEPVFEQLSYKFDIYVVGFPLEGTPVPSYIKGYHEVRSVFTEIKFGPLDTCAVQTRYFAAAVGFPRPDVIYAFDWSIYQAAVEVARHFKAPLVARMCLSPILLQRQGYTYGLDMNQRTERAIHTALCEMEIRGLQAADKVVHISEGYRQEYEQYIPAFKEKTVVVPNGINFSRWNDPAYVPYELPGRKDKKKIIFIGRITPTKGIEILCKAKVPDEFDLIIIGPRHSADSKCFDLIQEKTKEASNVFYMDAVYDEEKIQALKNAYAMIIPSLHEPFGTVGLEGLAAQCIVLSSRVGGLGDFLTDTNSIYCGTSVQDIELAYEKLRALSDEERAYMIESGVNTCKAYSVEASAQQLHKVFESLIHKTKTR